MSSNITFVLKLPLFQSNIIPPSKQTRKHPFKIHGILRIKKKKGVRNEPNFRLFTVATSCRSVGNLDIPVGDILYHLM